MGLGDFGEFGPRWGYGESMSANFHPRARAGFRVTATTVALALAAPGVAAAASLRTGSGHATNGIDAMTPTAALAAGAKALRSQPNILLSGTITEKGARVALDLRSSGHGANLAGSMTSYSSTFGFTGKMSLVKLPGALYLHAGHAVWVSLIGTEKMPTAVRSRLLTLLATHWIKLTGTAATSFATSVKSLTPMSLAANLTQHNGVLTKGTPVTVRGVSTLPIHSSTGSTVFLARSGPPLPMKASGNGTGTSGAAGAVFLSYPKTVAITAPLGARTLAQIEASILK